jgi:hypothetical protein
MGLDSIVFAPFAVIFLYLSVSRLFKKVDFTKDEELKLENYSHTKDIGE